MGQNVERPEYDSSILSASFPEAQKRTDGHRGKVKRVQSKQKSIKSQTFQIPTFAYRKGRIFINPYSTFNK